LSCAPVITTYAKERDCANIITYSLCAPLYTVENYSKAYAELFHHVPDSWYWAEYNAFAILPLEISRPLSRPPSIRVHGTMDEGREGHRCNRYNNCKKQGHDKSRCPNPSTPSSSTE